MKFSAQEEYGLRCLIRIARFYEMGKSLTIPEISRGEGITEHTTAKILRVLRLGGFLESERGHLGGYTLSRPPGKIYFFIQVNPHVLYSKPQDWNIEKLSLSNGIVTHKNKTELSDDN